MTTDASSSNEAPAATGDYRDDDLVYVDPDTRAVVGRVEWSNAGKPKSLAMTRPEPEDPSEESIPEPMAGKGRTSDKRREKRKPRVRYYPWGTYRSMKRVYKIEGKVIKEESNKTLDEVIEKALNEPFWD